MESLNNNIFRFINHSSYYKKEKGLPNQPISISLQQFKYIQEQINNCLVKIECPFGGYGTGFICVIPLQEEKWESNLLPALVTSNLVLREKDINSGKIIKFSIDNKQVEVKIDTNRLYYISDEFDITIIEIKKTDNLNINFFLEIDNFIFKKDVDFKNFSIYLIHYLKGEPSFSSGIVKSLEDFTLSHTCDSGSGSTGGPIINLLNLKVIGIHIGGEIGSKPYNLGTFLKSPIEKMINKYKNYKALNYKDLKNMISSNKIINLVDKNSNIEEKNRIIDSLKFKIIKLNEDLSFSKKIIENQKNKIQELEGKLKNINNNKDNSQINEFLKTKIKEKDEKLKEFEKKIEILEKSNKAKLIPADRMMCVYFTSNDQRVNYPIACVNTDIFAEVEEKLYQEYPEYRETNNYFIMDGKQILRFKTVGENKITNGRPVMLVVPIYEEKK